MAKGRKKTNERLPPAAVAEPVAADAIEEAPAETPADQPVQSSPQPPAAAHAADAQEVQAHETDLQAALAEVQQLKAALALKDTEIAVLKATRPAAAAPVDIQKLQASRNDSWVKQGPHGAGCGGMQLACHAEFSMHLACKLCWFLPQDRLQQLKKEQADADSAREAAWRQLKSVVSEISRLAGPETNSKPQPASTTPAGTQAITAV